MTKEERRTERTHDTSAQSTINPSEGLENPMHTPTCNYPDGGCGKPATIMLTVDDPELLITTAYACPDDAYDAIERAPGNAIVTLLEFES